MEFELTHATRHADEMAGLFVPTPMWTSKSGLCEIKVTANGIHVDVPVTRGMAAHCSFAIYMDGGMTGFVVRALLDLLNATETTEKAVLTAINSFMDELCTRHVSQVATSFRRGDASRESIRRYMKSHGI